MTGSANSPPSNRPEADTTWRKQVEEARRVDRDALPEELAPPDAFSDRRGTSGERKRRGYEVPGNETGGNSHTVTSRLRMSCAGWRAVPTATEFYAAVHEPTGSDRETAILLTWYHEADIVEQIHARLEGAYRLARTGAGAAPRGTDPRAGGTTDQPVRATIGDETKPPTDGGNSENWRHSLARSVPCGRGPAGGRDAHVHAPLPALEGPSGVLPGQPMLPVQLYEPFDQLGVPGDMEDVARNVAADAARHEGLAPEAG